MALGPKTDNSIEGGDGNAQVGHNSGTITMGYTIEQHESALERALERERGHLKQAHGAELERIQRDMAELQSRLDNKEKDYAERVEELLEHKQKLERFSNQIEKDKLDAAQKALDRGDDTLAEALFKEVLEKVKLRRADEEKAEAELEFELGKIAERSIRWQNAAKHYARAAQLDSNFYTLIKARALAWLSGEYKAALRYGEDLIALAAKDTLTEKQKSAAYNEHALTLDNLGRYEDAELLYRQSIEALEKVVGVEDSDYATRLNNLAAVLHSQDRIEEAALLYRQALEIDGEIAGTIHPDYATRLSNFAGILRTQGLYGESEHICRQVIEIDAKSIGPDHPEHAIHLNNLALTLEVLGKYDEAEKYFRQSLEVDVQSIGAAHPAYAIHVHNLAGFLEAQGQNEEADKLYRQAIPIMDSCLGAEHPYTIQARKNLEDLLAKTTP